MPFANLSIDWGLVAAVGVPLLYVLAGLSGLDALMRSRTSQGSLAWMLGLFAFPPIAVPLYWVFGHDRFADYVEALRSFDKAVEQEIDGRGELVPEGFRVAEQWEDARLESEIRAFERLAETPFTRGNHARLLVDGDATFDAIFAAIDGAQTYVLAQFYIIHDDEIGRAFRDRLIAAAQRGVRVHLLYDGVGSYALPRSYTGALREAGVQVAAFSGQRNWLGRFRLNFRNHRKIVVVDGLRACAGGLNVGDEYLGRDPKLSPWRDTHLALEGPAVLTLQYSFVRDWYYAQQDIPDLNWEFTESEGEARALVIATGPADPLLTCGLLFSHAIESAEHRLWIATPYFVPDGRVLGALQTAALRGVDVRILMPRQSDSVLFKHIPYAYLSEITRAGAHVHLYEPGFMHQKVMLVDDDYAAVGTANLDNRSFRLNFEVTCLLHDSAFCEDVAAMLERDFAQSTRLHESDLTSRSFPARLASQVVRLLAPIL